MKIEGTIDTTLFYSIFDSCYNGIIAVDIKGKIVVFNHAARKILDIKDRNPVGSYFRDFDSKTWPAFQRILKSGVPQIGIKNKIGGLTIVANRTPVIVNNKINGVISIFQDMSEFEKVSMELSSYKRLARELDTIIESSYDGISMTDGEGRLLRVNLSWEKITGLRADEVMGRSMAELEEEGYVSDAIPMKVLKHRRRITLPSHVIRTNRDVLVTGNPIFDDGGNIIMVVTNVRDMTDLNKLNKQLEQSKQLAKEYYSKLKEIRMQKFGTEDVIAVSKPMRDVVDLALTVADADAPVLIQGETGVGKEVIAGLIHSKSSRSKRGEFVKINCGAIPENLLESELFGYEKGAFTGALDSGKKGQFEIAEGGTLFLDEIEALPLNLQVKLLNAVQDLKIRRVGGTKPKKIDTRIIAASNRDLYQMVHKDRFREDLFYRLNVIPIYIPPLRERKEDILPLIHLFLRNHNAAYGRNKRLSRPVIDCLIEYPWEGNVRELSNIIERLVVITPNEETTLEDLPEKIRFFDRTNFPKYPLFTVSSLKEAVMEFESNMIRQALDRYGNIGKAADFLKVDRTTITRKMKKYTSMKTGE